MFNGNSTHGASTYLYSLKSVSFHDLLGVQTETSEWKQEIIDAKERTWPSFTRTKIQAVCWSTDFLVSLSLSFSSSFSPGVGIGNPPQPSKQVCVYSVSPNTQSRRFLQPVICCTQKKVIVSLVTLSESDSICIERLTLHCAISHFSD